MLTTQQIQEWSRTCGSSFYLLDLDAALYNYRHLLAAGQTIYPQFEIAYSVKSNYTPALCKALSDDGALMEVVSEMEYDLVLKTGHQANKIIVNGPAHTAAFMERAMKDGAVVNFDSFYQLDFLEEIVKKHPAKLYKFGVRLMLDMSSCIPSRFGFPADESTLTKLAERLKKISNGALVSLHCHFCEGARDSSSYSLRGQKMIELHEQYFSGFPVQQFNLGGGFYSKMPDELKVQFSDKIPELEVYADALCQPFTKNFNADFKPQLLTEPGNALVADAMQFYCPVIDIKEPPGRTVAILDGSIFDIKPTRNRKNLPLKIVHMGGAKRHVKKCDLTGFTCLEDDLLYRGFSGDIAPGDYAVFSNTGAYTNVLRPPFIRPSAAIVAQKGEELFLAKKPGSLDSVIQDYIL